VIVPFHHNLEHLERCLAALAPDSAPFEIIIASHLCDGNVMADAQQS